MKETKKISRVELMKLVTDDNNEKIILEIINHIKRIEVLPLNKRIVKKIYIKLLASNLSYSINNIVHMTTNNKIKELLSEANAEQDILVKYSQGVSFNSKFISPKTKINNLTGKEIECSQYIKPKVIFSKGYIKSL